MATGKYMHVRQCLQGCRTVNRVNPQHIHYPRSNARKYAVLCHQNVGRKFECSTCSMSSFPTFIGSRSLCRSRSRKHAGQIVALLHPNPAFLERNNCYSTRPSPRSRTHYYNVLNVTPNATQSQIKAAYYQLSKVYHPDINKHHEASVKFSSITEAYEVLGNVRNRHLYDRGVFNPQTSRGGAHDHEESEHFRQEEGFSSTRKKPPTGRTKIYNFDEFYRLHYQSAREKKLNERIAYENWKKVIMEGERQKALNRFVMSLAILILMGVSIASSLGAGPSSGPKSRNKSD